MAPVMQKLFSAGRVGFRIVSNLTPERTSKASFSIPVSKLGYKDYDGTVVARNIVEAYEWAMDDPYRAVTHNKGSCSSF